MMATAVRSIEVVLSIFTLNKSHLKELLFILIGTELFDITNFLSHMVIQNKSLLLAGKEPGDATHVEPSIDKSCQLYWRQLQLSLS
jgi:hypothetical protein